MVPPEAYDNSYPSAHEMREMYQYYEPHTYFGPEHQKRIAAANALVPGGFTGFALYAEILHELLVRPEGGRSCRLRSLNGRDAAPEVVRQPSPLS